MNMEALAGIFRKYARKNIMKKEINIAWGKLAREIKRKLKKKN